MARATIVPRFFRLTGHLVDKANSPQVQVRVISTGRSRENAQVRPAVPSIPKDYNTNT